MATIEIIMLAVWMPIHICGIKKIWFVVM